MHSEESSDTSPATELVYASQPWEFKRTGESLAAAFKCAKSHTTSEDDRVTLIELIEEWSELNG